MVVDSGVLRLFGLYILQYMPWIPRDRSSSDGPQRTRDRRPCFPRPEKEHRVLALWSMCARYVMQMTSHVSTLIYPAGAVIGGVFAAIFSELTWWPWTYWAQGIILFAYTTTSFLILPSDERGVAAEGSKPTFDFAGTITGVTGLVLFNFAWNQAGVVGWTVPYTYILLIVGILFFGAFLYIERNFARHPLVPIKNLSSEALYALSIIACGWASFGIWLYYLWQLFLRFRHLSPLVASAQAAPPAVSGLCASLAVGFFLAKTKVACVMVFAMACFLAGQIILATAPVSQTYWAQTFVTLIVMPWGMDLSFPCGTIILSESMPREHQGIAASLVNTVVNYSISVSLGIAGTIIRQTNNGGANRLGSIRNAWYFAIGLDGLGLSIALLFMWVSVFRRKSVS